MVVQSLIAEHKVVAIARKIDTKYLIDATNAMLKGGVKAFEITFDQAADSYDSTAQSIALLRKEFGDQIVVGAGTVVSLGQLRIANESGAQFALAPNTDLTIIKEGKNLGMVMIPGAFTPSEVMDAWNAGADIVKLFPAGILGIPYLRAIRGPINHIPLMAVGGIDETNIKIFLEHGCMSAGIGSNLFRADLIVNKQWDELTRLASMFVEATK